MLNIRKAVAGLGRKRKKPAADESTQKSQSAPEGGADDDHLPRTNALRFLRVEDVMVTRSDIMAVEIGTPIDDVMRIFRACKHSRLPVYRDNLDEPIGFLHIKDLVLDPTWLRKNSQTPITEQFVRKALVVPPSKRANVLLQEMQTERIHMALIIDEFGGVDGLVTIEDLVEEIVGEIEDEHDARSHVGWTKNDDGDYICAARLRLDTLEKECGVKLRTRKGNGHADTLGGFMVELHGQVPQSGYMIKHPDGHVFKILAADPRRIHKIQMTLSNHPGKDVKAST